MKKLYVIALMSTCVPMFGTCNLEEFTYCKDAPELQEPVEIAADDEGVGQCEGEENEPNNIVYLHKAPHVLPGTPDLEAFESFLKLAQQTPILFPPNGTVVVVLYSDECGPCAQFSKMIREVAQLGVIFMKVNVALCPEFAKRYFLGVVPHTIVFQNGKQMAQHLGLPTSVDDFIGYIKHSVSVPSEKPENSYAKAMSSRSVNRLPKAALGGCAEE
jgi:thiol-disulfide isomerase/thioredoxin